MSRLMALVALPEYVVPVIIAVACLLVVIIVIVIVTRPPVLNAIKASVRVSHPFSLLTPCLSAEKERVRAIGKSRPDWRRLRLSARRLGHSLCPSKHKPRSRLRLPSFC